MCPNCHCVLKEGCEHLAAIYTATDDKYDGSKDIPCRECDAMNRNGLVRCWQCGAFLREEIEQVYQKMKSHPAPAEPISQQSEAGEELVEADATASDDDFELSEDVNMFQATENWFTDSQQETSSPEAPEVSVSQDDEPDEEEAEDDLHNLAVSEEKEMGHRPGKKKSSSGPRSFLVKGPCGACRIRVQNYHQGRIGQCPKCSLPFMVPVLATPNKKVDKKKKGKQSVETGTLAESQLIPSAHWHEIIEKKFKPKAKALAGKGGKVDLIRCDQGLLIVWVEKKGLTGVSAAQTEKTRGEIAGHILAGKPLDKIPASRSELIPTELLQQIRFAWPVTEQNKTEEDVSEEHFTAGIPVFGEFSIVLEIPSLPQPAEDDLEAQQEAPVHPGLKQSKKKSKPKKPKKKKVKPPAEPPIRCLAFSLSQYRKVRNWLCEMTEQPNALTVETIPLENFTEPLKCELSEIEFEALGSPDFYQDDPSLETTVVGWSCGSCDAVISEEARVEQKFGGKKPAGLTKAKCPQCEEKFGQNPLYHLTSVVAPPAEPEEDTQVAKESEETSNDAAADSEKSEKKPKTKFSLKGMLQRKKKKSDSESAE